MTRSILGGSLLFLVAVATATELGGCGSTVLVTDCGAGEASCEDGCADLARDPDHCGSCDTSCDPGEVCIDGGCTSEPPPPTCEAPLQSCFGACVDTTSDPSNCGACGTTCPGPCFGSQCVADCPPGLSPCGGSCFDLLNDPGHCGSCDIACGDAACVQGKCGEPPTCPPDLTPCFGECVDTQFDPHNCQFCGNDCGPGGDCQFGACVEPGCEFGVCGICTSSALPPTTSFFVDGTTTSASNDHAASCTGETGGNDVLWEFTPTVTGHYVFDAGGGALDTILEALDTGCAPLACNDDFAGGVDAHLELDLIAGQTIYLVVDGFGAGDYALSGQLDVSCGPGLTPCSGGCVDTTSDPNNCGGCGAPCPVGWTCAASMCQPPAPVCPTAALPGTTPQTLGGSTVGATNTMQGVCAPSTAPEHTFTFTPATSGTFTINTAGSNYDTVLYILSGSCAGPQIACNDDTNGLGLQSQLVVSLVGGQTYTIVVDGWGDAAGSYTLHIQ